MTLPLTTAQHDTLLAELDEARREAERYRLLAEQSTDMISRHTPTPDWTYVDVSPAVERLLGYRAAELIGTPGRALFHPDDADNLIKRSESVSYRGGLYTNVYRYRHKDGHYVWLETTSRTIRADSGERVEIICVSRDVTAREQAQRATRRLARVVESSSDMIMFCAPGTLQLTYLNEAASTTLGSGQDGGIAINLRQLVDAHTYSSLLLAGLEHAAQHGCWYGSIALQLPPGKDSRIAEIREIIAHRNHVENRRVEYYSIIGRDITLKRKAEDAARRQQLELAHMSRLLSVGEMATGLAHEINQPLAAILNYCRGTLRRAEDGKTLSLEQALQAMQLISGQARRAAEIIKRIRSYVKRTEYQRIEFPINDSCQDVAGFLHQEARDNQIEFSFDLDPDDPRLTADRIQIEQVLLNLIRNAIEAYSDCEQPQRTVNISSRCDEGYIEVTITDRAKGVSAEALSQLFDAFFTSKPSGLGMGLAISRTIIESHGGQLWAQSDGHSGTVFKFRLPVSRHQDHWP
ncbi:PAS domain-containing sensor histidine kinase [Marinobacterium rhizophilum]|uniref:PAS domain-containing sensor histidine kinase n=1 Tax=Marinobacterium rhizophilum TaxID=420402 RepID=UPI000373206C|nr:PAS domain S-box protein [Marinobacterium rhizophilum]